MKKQPWIPAALIAGMLFTITSCKQQTQTPPAPPPQTPAAQDQKMMQKDRMDDGMNDNQEMQDSTDDRMQGRQEMEDNAEPEEEPSGGEEDVSLEKKTPAETTPAKKDAAFGEIPRKEELPGAKEEKIQTASSSSVVLERKEDKPSADNKSLSVTNEASATSGK